MFEQMSLFDATQTTSAMAVSCWDLGENMSVNPIEDWMKKLVPEGRFFGIVGTRHFVLKPAGYPVSRIPIGHQFFHYTVGNDLFTGIFVGTGGEGCGEDED